MRDFNKKIKKANKFCKTNGKTNKYILYISYGEGKYNIFLKESIFKITKMDIKEDDEVILLDDISNEKFIGKVISKKPYSGFKKIYFSDTILLKKVSWLDKLKHKLGIL